MAVMLITAGLNAGELLESVVFAMCDLHHVTCVMGVTADPLTF
jgi:hypothetical protein